MESNISTLIRSFLDDDSFLACVERMQLHAGEVIVFEHQSDRDMYLVESGGISINRHDQDPIYMGSGTLIGELSFLQGTRRTATIIASKDTLCLQIQEKPFLKWLQTHPRKSIIFYRHLSLAIADRLHSNIQREETRLLFGKESPILRQSEQEILELAHRLRDQHLRAEAKKKTIESEIRDSLKQLQAEQEEDDASEIFWVTENTEESLFSNLISDMGESSHDLFAQTCSVFSSLNTWLNRFHTEELRMDIAQRAREQFAVILEKTSIYKELLISKGTESPNLMSEVLLAQPIDSNDKAITAAICTQETIQAYRAQILWYQKQIRSLSHKDIESITLINDITGVLFSMLYPLCAPYPIDIHFFVDNPYSFGCVDVNFQQYGRARYLRGCIQNWFSDVISGAILVRDQDYIFLPTILDYLSTARSAELLRTLYGCLKPNGTLYFAVLSDTNDSAFFCDFLGWSTIRRKKEEVVELLKSVGYTNIIVDKASGSLCVTAKKN